MMTEYFKITGIFLQKIWRVPTIMTEYFEISDEFLASRDFSSYQGRIDIPISEQFQPSSP
jgi:hypothetical protein